MSTLDAAGGHARRKFAVERIRTALLALKGRDERRWLFRSYVNHQRAVLSSHTDSEAKNLATIEMQNVNSRRAGGKRLGKAWNNWMRTGMCRILASWQLNQKESMHSNLLEGLNHSHTDRFKSVQKSFAETVIKKLRFRMEQLLKGTAVGDFRFNYDSWVMGETQAHIAEERHDKEIRDSRDRVARLRRIEIRVGARKIQGITKRAILTWVKQAAEDTIGGVEALYQKAATQAALNQAKIDALTQDMATLQAKVRYNNSCHMSLCSTQSRPAKGFFL